MKKFFRFLFDTDRGPAFVWFVGSVCSILLSFLLAPLAALVPERAEPLVSIAIFLPHVCGGLAALAAFLFTLLKRDWPRAGHQILLGFGMFFVLLVEGGLFAVLSPAVALLGPDGPWLAPVGESPFPFAVECRRANPFLSSPPEKRLAFPSGNRVSLVRDDRNGNRNLAVYDLGDGTFLLAAGNPRHLRSGRTFYRVDPAAETVTPLPRDCADRDDAPVARYRGQFDFLGAFVPPKPGDHEAALFGAPDSDAPAPLATEGGAE